MIEPLGLTREDSSPSSITAITTTTDSMTTSPIKNRFLSSQEDLGVVAVGFSGGQVCFSSLRAVL